MSAGRVCVVCPQPLSAPRPQEEVPVPGRRLPNPRGGCAPSQDRFPIQRGGLLSSYPCPPEPRAPPAFPADRLTPVYSLELLSVCSPLPPQCPRVLPALQAVHRQLPSICHLPDVGLPDPTEEMHAWCWCGMPWAHWCVHFHRPGLRSRHCPGLRCGIRGFGPFLPQLDSLN